MKDDRIYQYLYSAIFSTTTVFWRVAEISTNAVFLLVTQILTFLYEYFVTQRPQPHRSAKKALSL